MSEDIMPTFRQKIKLNNEELISFHQDVNSWREKLKGDEIVEPSTLEDLCHVLCLDEESEEDPAENLVSEGNKCLQKGEWSRAISLYSSAISKNNNVARYYINRALAYIKRNSPSEAEKDCTQAISLKPEYKQAYLRRACARKQLGKCKESCEDLEVVLKMEPDNDIVLAEYEAMIKYIQNELLKNKTEGDDGIQQEKTEIADKLKQQGNKMIEKGDYVGAKEKFTAAIELHPKDPTYYANRAICHMKLMDFKTAEKDCNAALKLDMKYVKVYIRRGRVRRKLKKVYDARQDFYNAYELSPDDSAILDELEEVDKVIRKSEESRMKKGMAVQEVGIVPLLVSKNGGGDTQKIMKLNWNELRPRKNHLTENEEKIRKAESFQESDSKEKKLPKSQNVQDNENQGETKLNESFRGVPKNTSKVKNAQTTETYNNANYNMREVFPLKSNDPVAKLSGPFLKVRVDDAKFAVPEQLFEIPDEFKHYVLT